MSKTFSVQKMAIIALMTAVLCILAPISIPVFISPVPISLGVLAIYLTAYVLSPLDATISVIIFILLGTFGLPVFSGYSGGLSKLVGPTGGYIIGFLFTVYISSLFIHMKKGIILGKKYIINEDPYILTIGGTNDNRLGSLLHPRYNMVFISTRKRLYRITAFMCCTFLNRRCYKDYSGCYTWNTTK